MKINIESNGIQLQVATQDETKNVDFKTLVKVYELVTGDELEINETEPRKPAITPEPTMDIRTIADDLEPDRTPGWHEPVKVKLMCPYCGKNATTTTLYGNRFMKCPDCGGKVLLQSATSHWGVPDHNGFYYKATEAFIDRNQAQVNDDLLKQMKERMESGNVGKDDEHED